MLLIYGLVSYARQMRRFKASLSLSRVMVRSESVIREIGWREYLVSFDLVMGKAAYSSYRLYRSYIVLDLIFRSIAWYPMPALFAINKLVLTVIISSTVCPDETFFFFYIFNSY